MQVHRSTGQLPPFQNAVLTIGTFDGVHQGHRILIDALCREAGNVKGESVIITFDPHPRKVVRPNEALQLINTPEEKIRLLSGTGISHLVIVPFTPAFAEQSAEAYVESFLVEKFRPHTVIIGYDHHFGKERKGNFKLLQEQAPRFGYRLKEIPKHVLDEIAVSSTKIRKAILQSDIQTANRLLGYDFFFEGTVVHGDHLGRQLGYPTANLETSDREKIQLGDGVYAVYVDVGESRKKGMLSIGTRPTLADSERKTEVNIFEWTGELYGQTLRVTVKHFLRKQEKYASLEELKTQLQKDREQSLKLL